MRRGLKSIVFDDFSGGLNTKESPGSVADNQYTDALNVYLVGKRLAKRKGYERYISTRIDSANAGTGIFNAPFIAADQVVASAGTDICKKVGTAWTSIKGSIALTADKYMLWTMIENTLVGVNGTDPAFYYTGTGNATTLSGSNIPTAPTACAYFHGRLFLSTGRQVVWSEYMNKWKEPFPDTNEQFFPESITGMNTLGGSNQQPLIITTKNRIAQCIFDPSIGDYAGGSGTFRFETISDAHGNQSPYSLQECYTDSGANVLIWADSDGLKAMDSSLTIRKLTENIQPTWDALNISQMTSVQGVYYKPKRWYMLFCKNGTATTNDTVLIYDLKNWCPVGVFDWTVSVMGIVPVSGVDRIVGSDYSGYWNQYDSTQSDNEAAINGYFKTNTKDGSTQWSQAMAVYYKHIKAIVMNYDYFGQYNFDITVYYDNTGQTYSTTHAAGGGAVIDVFILDQDIIGAAEQPIIAGESLIGIGRTVRVKIGNADAGEPFRVGKIIIPYVPGKMGLYV